MTTISSSSLFHFTRKSDYLIQILQNEFRPRYYPEKIVLVSGRSIVKAIPMVCFCDIPLSQVKEHIKTYGEYGIGLTKEWAFKNKLTPVQYLQKDSHIAVNISNILYEFSNNLINTPELKILRNAFVETIRNIKNYQGDFTRDGKIIKDVKFYDEREWRFIPKPVPGFDFWLEKTKYLDPLILSAANAKTEKLKLKFEPEDIKYIIVKHENEIKPMIAALKMIKSKYTSDIVEILTTRIITAEQIKTDF
jgi:hypothetical protein